MLPKCQLQVVPNPCFPNLAMSRPSAKQLYAVRQIRRLHKQHSEHRKLAVELFRLLGEFLKLRGYQLPSALADGDF